MPDVFVGRQPIFDRQLKTVGYELLYRSYNTDHAAFTDGDCATSQVILNTFAEIGLDRIVGKSKGFINLTRNFLLDKYPIPFPPYQVVLEVPEGISIDQELIDALKALSDRGYQIALDDVTSPQEVEPFLEIAHLVKIDLLAMPAGSLEESVRRLRRYEIKLLAEKVENQKDLQCCMALGFDYFQGYFLCKPQTIRGRQIPPARLVIINLLGLIQDPYIDYPGLEEVVARDISLGYKLLRLVNSAYFGFPVEIRSIRQAMLILGLDQLRGWLALFLLSETGDKPLELTLMAMARAKMCELLASATGEGQKETYFMVGLFSVLDALLDLPMDRVLELLPLTKEVAGALLSYQGKLGGALKCVLAYESGEWNAVEFNNLSHELIRDAYLEALAWANMMGNELQGKIPPAR